MHIDQIRAGSAPPRSRVGAAREVIDDNNAAIEESEITRKIVRRALADLPEHQRTLLMLVCVDRMSYKEAAELLDISIETVAAKVARARQALGEQIALRSRRDVGYPTIQLEPARADAEGGEHSC